MDTLEFLAVLQGLHRAKRGRKPTPPEYLTPTQLSERWGGLVALGTLANWRSMKRGPQAVRFASRVLYPFADVERWELAQLAALTPAKGARRGL